MSRSKLIVLAEWALVLVLVLLFVHERLYTTGGSLTPEKAHLISEASRHYGPSTIARKADVPFAKHEVVFLGAYKDWFSADVVTRSYGTWGPGTGSGPMKIDRSKPMTYSWSGNSTGQGNMGYLYCGYAADAAITDVELLMKEKETGEPIVMREKLTDDRMFLFMWETKNGSRQMQAIRGLDAAGNVRYDEKLN